MYLVEGGANFNNRKKVWFWLFIVFRVSTAFSRTVAKFIVPDWGVKVDPMLSSQGLWIYWLLVDPILHISLFVPVQDYGILLASGTMPNVLNPVELNFSGLGAIRDYNRWYLHIWCQMADNFYTLQSQETKSRDGMGFLSWMDRPCRTFTYSRLNIFFPVYTNRGMPNRLLVLSLHLFTIHYFLHVDCNWTIIK